MAQFCAKDAKHTPLVYHLKFVCTSPAFFNRISSSSVERRSDTELWLCVVFYENYSRSSAQMVNPCLVLVWYSDQLKEIGVVDEVIWEPAQGETYKDFPIMAG